MSPPVGLCSLTDTSLLLHLQNQVSILTCLIHFFFLSVLPVLFCCTHFLLLYFSKGCSTAVLSVYSPYLDPVTDVKPSISLVCPSLTISCYWYHPTDPFITDFPDPLVTLLLTLTVEFGSSVYVPKKKLFNIVKFLPLYLFLSFGIHSDFFFFFSFFSLTDYISRLEHYVITFPGGILWLIISISKLLHVAIRSSNNVVQPLCLSGVVTGVLPLEFFLDTF